MPPAARGCAVAPRGPQALPRCTEEAPPAIDAGSRHRVWCWARLSEPAPVAMTACDPPCTFTTFLSRPRSRPGPRLPRCPCWKSSG
ncbi:hypothetical protein G6F52_014232 [Rhizopus delemar]|nr:hypothetical protein G6F52_014232 [Rhizopus delemar]